MMAQFASAADLAGRLGVEFTAAQTARANGILADVSGVVQTVAGQRIELVVDDVLTLTGRPDARLRLPERPVVSVASVTLDGAALTAGVDWVRAGDTLVRECGRGWGDSRSVVVVVYTHGYDPAPPAARSVCIEAGVRLWVNPGSVMEESYGSERVFYSRQGIASGLMLTPAEEAYVKDALRMTAGSTRLR